MRLLFIPLTLLLTACQTTVSPDWFAKSDTDIVCLHATSEPTVTMMTDAKSIDNAIAELSSRGFTNKELKYIRDEKIYIGMSEKALLCSWGKPQRTNTSASAYGQTIQYVYGDQYVYVENNKVRSFQNYN